MRNPWVSPCASIALDWRSSRWYCCNLPLMALKLPASAVGSSGASATTCARAPKSPSLTRCAADATCENCRDNGRDANRPHSKDDWDEDGHHGAQHPPVEVGGSGWRALDAPLLLQRPGIRQAEWKLRAANADIGAARTAFFPPITLRSNVGTASDGLNGWFSAVHMPRACSRGYLAPTPLRLDARSASLTPR